MRVLMLNENTAGCQLKHGVPLLARHSSHSLGWAITDDEINLNRLFRAFKHHLRIGVVRSWAREACRGGSRSGHRAGCLSKPGGSALGPWLPFARQSEP